MSRLLLSVEELEMRAGKARFKPAELATVCALSLRQLERFFDQRFNTTPSHWLRGLQFDLAKELLVRGCSNKAVVLELNFASESHFCREFKKIFGTKSRCR